jgi:hypothetical protein
MDTKRYVMVLAIKKNDNELIPIWDDRIEFDEHPEYGYTISLSDSRYQPYSPIECLYDLKTRKIIPGIEVNYYPSEDDMKFKVGESVYFERKNRAIDEAVIDKIVYEEYNLNMKKGEDIDTYWVDKYGITDLDIRAKYAIKEWKPIYVLNNEERIKWEHQLYKKHIEKQ